MSFKSTSLYRVLLSLMFCVATACTSFSQITNALTTNTWQVSITRIQSRTKETGAAFVNFNPDGAYSGYGLTTLSGGLLTFSGNWSMDAKGNILGRYAQDSGPSGDIAGKASSKALVLTITTTNSTYKLSGKPVTSPIPDLSGSWNSSFTVAHSTTAEVITLSAEEGFPGVFEFAGGNPDDVQGGLIVTPSGHLAVLLEDSTTGETAGIIGKFNQRRQAGSASGKDSNNHAVRAKISRP